MSILPPGYVEFLLGKIDEYEDHGIKAVRHPGGGCEITGKPISPVFIYAIDPEAEEETLP